ncbi:TrmH family RNA methyltransferase [Ruminiclostridium josui]|uniref:TrmH family RNA methyltransferase n=1 Tax=Ruminiclostridium josui TaxID=1499 RepID=UPI000464AB6A|nr:TrmH family RNA methyltransferase [Ruminiclostridium josui]
MFKFKNYKKDAEYTYTFGAYPTIELLKLMPGVILKVFISTSFYKSEFFNNLNEICIRERVEVVTDDKFIQRISPKENCLVVGVLKKYNSKINASNNHVVLVNPSNMGNLGTIIRTLVGFGISDLALVRPAVDIFDPKVIRASMGALFSINFEYYNEFDEYLSFAGNHNLYMFMLDGKEKLHEINQKDNIKYPFSLVFGNESRGLPKEFSNYGVSLAISQNDCIDSLSLQIAVSIAAYEFTKELV